MVAGIWSSVGGGVFVNRPPRCRWRWSVSMPGLLIHRAVIADVDVVKIVVLLRSPNFHRHCGDWLPRNLTVFLAALFLENCPSLLPSCESSKCRVIWSRVNARWHRPPPTSASPLARFGQRDGPAMRRRLRLSRLLLSGCRWPRASKYADEPRWPRWWSQSTGLTADYVVSRQCNDWRHASGPSDGSPRTSVWICWTLLGYLLHSPVKVASRSTAGSKAAGQLSKRLSISYHPKLGKRRAATNTNPLFRGMQAAAFTCTE